MNTPDIAAAPKRKRVRRVAWRKTFGSRVYRRTK